MMFDPGTHLHRMELLGGDLADIEQWAQMMSEIRVSGRTVATAATANHVAAQIWNPHATLRITVTEMHCAITTAGLANLGLARSTARGTAGSTITPAIQNEAGREVAPPSGLLLDLAAFTVQPTLDSSTLYLDRWNLPAAIGAGVILPFVPGLVIPPGAGLCLLTPPAVIFPASDVTFVVDDG